MADTPNRTPPWVWGVILGLAATQPLASLLATNAAPPGTVPTGLLIPDSALFLYSMEMIPSGFHSAYATCQAAAGAASLTYYSVPHLWLYGLLGLVIRWLPGNALAYYALANAAGAVLYLWAVYRFLRTLFPRHAQPAFLLFALSAGPGGLLYVLTGMAGLHGQAQFESLFFRFAVYDLMEGPHFHPVLYFPRLYYTLSLAGCLAGFSATVRALDSGHALSWGWRAMILLASFLDARFAVFTFGLLVLYLACRPSTTLPDWKNAGAGFGLPAGAGLLVAAALMSLNPAVVENHRTAGAMAMWFSPFVAATALHWLAGGRALGSGFQSSPWPVRVLLAAGIGYLATYAIGYVLYQGYYGNLLSGRDGSVAAHVSDPALLGAVLGVAWAWRRPIANATADAPPAWLLLWLIGYTALALSGFGQGWFLRFGPQRLQVFIWLPLCVVAAQGLTSWTPRGRAMAFGVLVACGVSGVAVATLAFQSPLGRAGAAGPYTGLHPENMVRDDAELLAQIGEGTVLAPAPASDVVVRLRGNPVVFGIGSFNLTDRPYAELRGVADTFFDPGTTNDQRETLARTWSVTWVYCPATWPVPGETIDQLRQAAWLEPVSIRSGALFRVR